MLEGTNNVTAVRGDLDYEQETEDLPFGGDSFICCAGPFPSMLGFGRAGHKSLTPPLVYPKQLKGFRD